jgi:hypothetical protein
LRFAGDKQGTLIGGGDGARSFSKRQVDGKTPQTIRLRPNAGFVLVLK